VIGEGRINKCLKPRRRTAQGLRASEERKGDVGSFKVRRGFMSEVRTFKQRAEKNAKIALRRKKTWRPPVRVGGENA